MTAIGFSRMKALLQNLVAIYLAIGGIVAALSFASALLFYTWGPGSPGMVAFTIGMTSAALRIISWPVGVYLVVTTDLGFFEWLFYLWYMPRTF